VNKSLAAGRSRGVTTLLPTKLEKDSYKHKFGVEESWQFSVAVAEIASPDKSGSQLQQTTINSPADNM
jgi:hypothetical protein